MSEGKWCNEYSGFGTIDSIKKVLISGLFVGSLAKKDPFFYFYGSNRFNFKDNYLMVKLE